MYNNKSHLKQQAIKITRFTIVFESHIFILPIFWFRPKRKVKWLQCLQKTEAYIFVDIKKNDKVVVTHKNQMNITIGMILIHKDQDYD